MKLSMKVERPGDIPFTVSLTEKLSSLKELKTALDLADNRGVEPLWSLRAKLAVVIQKAESTFYAPGEIEE